MNRVKLLVAVFAITVTALGIYSCAKDEHKTDSIESVSPRKVLDIPIKNGDVLQFRDYSHLSSYVADLNDLLTQDEVNFEASIFQPAVFQSVYWKLVNDEFADPKDRYMPFLTDPVMMAIVNEYYELRVGDVLVTYITNNQVLRSSASNVSTRTAIRNITKGTELLLANVPKGAAWGDDTDEQSFLGPWCGCEIKINRIDCNKVRVIGNCQDFVFGAGDGTIEIFLSNSQFFPPPGTIPTSTFRTNGNFSFDIPLSNTSTLFLHASARPDCFFNNLVTASTNGPSGSVCDPDDKDTGWLWAQNAAGTEGMSHRKSAYKNTWSGYEKAELFSKRFNGSSWVKNDANLRVTIDATRRSFGCSVTGTEPETKTCNSCSYKSATVNIGLSGHRALHHCDGDVVGTYRKIIGTTMLNAKGSPDFECCN